MDARSAGRALGRVLELGELAPAWVDGFERTWSLRERVFSHLLQREITAGFLDLTADPSARCNGVLLALGEPEMERMRRREKNYDVVDVTGRVSAFHGAPVSKGSVVTFVARPGLRIGAGEVDVRVMKRYVEMVDQACDAQGVEFQHAFIASTRPHPYPVLGGRYTFVDPAQAKLV